MKLLNSQEIHLALSPWLTPYDPTGVILHLAEYLGLTREGVKGLVYGKDPRKPLADLWMEQNPQTMEDFHAYYSSETGYYLWDLATFNTSPAYWIFKAGKALGLGGRIVDFGGGIGSLSIELAKNGAEVLYVDLLSPQRRFAEWRFKKLGMSIPVFSNLKEVDWANNIVAIDVMEHLHPEELRETCQEFARIVVGGEVFTANEFGGSVEWPMHQATGQMFEEGMRAVGFQGGPAIWVRTDDKAS